MSNGQMCNNRNDSLLSTDGIPHLLHRRLFALGLESGPNRVGISGDHIADMFGEALLGVGLDSVVHFVREVLRGRKGQFP